MTASDLQRAAPPRWSDAIDGIIWLPRLAAKVRAYDAGTLGTYLLGQSPVDDEFLKAAQLRYGDFIALVRATADDAAVLDGIGAASPGALDRLRLWSLEMPVRCGWMLRVLDADDGYECPAWLRVPIAVGNVLLTPLVGLLRKVRPLET
jgi:hypothetical protein